MTMKPLTRELAEDITQAFVNVGNLPEWMQTVAWGRDMSPLGELAAPVAQAAIDAAVAAVLSDLRERLVKADETLRHSARTASTAHRGTHLNSKAEGVRLTLSYLDEVIKETQR